MHRGVCILFILVSFGLASYAQTISLPAPLDVMKSVGNPERMYGYERIRPFGWSRDGKFAFLTEEDADGRGGIIFTYYVIDTVTDRKGWMLIDDSWDWDQEESDGEILAEASLSRNMKTLQAQFKKYKIVQMEKMELLPFPLTAIGSVFESKLQLESTEENTEFYSIKSIRLEITRDGTRSKTIFRNGAVDALSVWISGCIMSPFEKRILVLIGEEKFVFEGSMAFFEFSGCDLENGYK